MTKSEARGLPQTSAERKAWRQPELRRLPIAATAGAQMGNKPFAPGNDGGGQGKGEAGMFS